MRRTVSSALAAAGIVGVAWRLGRRSGRRRRQDEADRWLVVTVNCPVERLSGPLPEPLARISESVEVRVRTAPGGRGTELAAR
ncbi:MAG TPA: hypothetical protein VHJ17_12210, partial [Thermomonospora sp.]|nr:hypothetical protein [Thermomonospora sp.]